MFYSIEGPEAAAILVLMALINIIIFVCPRLRLRREAGLTPLYEERCTARRYLGFGLYGGAIPMRCSIYDEFLVLAGVVPIATRYSEIKCVDVDAPPARRRITMARLGPRWRIALYPQQPEKLLSMLGAKGVNVN